MTKDDLIRRVVERMTELGLTQNELAKACNLSQPHISKVLSGQVKLAKKTKARLSTWLDRRTSGAQGAPDEVLHSIGLRLQALPQKRLMQFMQFLQAIERLIAE